jgi:hypothetical protein
MVQCKRRGATLPACVGRIQLERHCFERLSVHLLCTSLVGGEREVSE